MMEMGRWYLHWSEGGAFLGADALEVVLAVAAFWEAEDAHGRLAAVAEITLGSGYWAGDSPGEDRGGGEYEEILHLEELCMRCACGRRDEMVIGLG